LDGIRYNNDEGDEFVVNIRCAHDEAMYFIRSPEGSLEQPDLIEDKHWVWYLSYPLLFTVFLVHNLIWGEIE
jgi:hypothetical protein